MFVNYSSGGATICMSCCKMEAILTYSIIVLIFDFLTSKRVTGHQCHGLPSANFQPPKLFHSRPSVRDRQTDDGHQRLMPHPAGAGA